MAFTPHARGSTRRSVPRMAQKRILPACAGVNPSASNQGHCGRNLPRMREGQPAEQSAQFCICNSPRTRGGQPWAQSIQSRVLFSPHTRGSTPHPQSFRRGYWILPACAGVTLISVVGKAKILNSPRMRGDQPTKRIRSIQME